MVSPELSNKMEEYSLKVAALVLSISERRIYSWINSGAVGTRIRTRSETFDSLLDDPEVENTRFSVDYSNVLLPTALVAAVRDIHRLIEDRLSLLLRSPQDLQALTQQMVDSKNALAQVKARQIKGDLGDLVC